MRLKVNFDTEGMESIALKLLTEQFSMFSPDPNVSNRVSKETQKALEKLKKKGDKVFTESSETDDDSDKDESDNEEAGEDDSDEEDDSGENTLRAKKNNSTPKPPKKKAKQSRKVKKKQEAFSGKVLRKLMKEMTSRMEEKLNEKFSSLNLNKNREKVAQKDKNKRAKPEKSKIKRKLPVESSEDSEESESCEEEEPRAPKRRPRSVADWKMKYDGKDEGKKLNKFIAEVEFMAEAERISLKDLFNEAIHLFTGDARTWYMEGKNNGDFRKWSELVTELKLEFQPPDMDYNYEQQAAQRRQKRSEKFQDFYQAEMEIFRYMAVQPTDQRMFDIIFRNLQSDYKNVLVIKGVRTLKALKKWGRKLDSANSWMYRSKDTEPVPKSAQVHEVSSGPPQKLNKPEPKTWKANDAGTKPNWKTNHGTGKPVAPKPQTQDRNDNQAGSSVGTSEKRLQNYRVPDKFTCFNCRGKNHRHEVCLLEKGLFCTICGFHDFPKEKCPFCLKNGRNSV